MLVLVSVGLDFVTSHCRFLSTMPHATLFWKSSLRNNSKHRIGSSLRNEGVVLNNFVGSSYVTLEITPFHSTSVNDPLSSESPNVRC